MLSGQIHKMTTRLTVPVEYRLPIGTFEFPLNPLLGHRLTLRYSGTITCIACGATTRKSFSQGYCYRCCTRLARCDMCIVKPETCHYHLGTCREPTWGEQHCMIPHYVYLANSSGLKVGITRTSQIPTRWIDQGASQAVPILQVQSRRQSGLVEAALKQFVADTTNWRTMLKGDVPDLDMLQQRTRLQEHITQAMQAVNQQCDGNVVEALAEPVVDIAYPVLAYPTKIRSLNLDKEPQAEGILQGIKGQYLILDTGVINLRKYTGYHLTVATD